MSKPLIQTTGRRKEAVARVRLRPGTGKIVVNGREFASYFPILTHQVIAKEPLRLTQTEEVYDVDATLGGGGVSGQAGAIRLGIARALVALDPESRGVLKKAGPPAARRAREGTAQVRPQEGAQGSAVLEAVALPARTRVALRYRRRTRRRRERSHDPVRRRARSRRRAGAAARARCFIGRDTRASGPRIEAGLAVGLQSEVVAAGAARRAADARRSRSSPPGPGMPAAIVSASHNPWSDNGVKVIGADGRKLPDGAEAAIEAELEVELASTWDRRGHTYVERRAVVRAPTRPAPTRTSRTCCRRSTAATSTVSTSCSTARTAPGSRSVRACCAPRARACTCCTPRPTVATSTTGAVRRTRSRCAARSSSAAPRSVSRSTATATA